jgi:hypothetical protein
VAEQLSLRCVARRRSLRELWIGRWVAALPPLVVLAPVACIYDADERCGPDQAFEEGQRVCADEFGLFGQECLPCAENEVSNPTGPCECAQGLIRLSEGDPRAEALGQPCNSDDECPSAGFPHCQLDGESGYCTTQDCEAGSGDCPADYSCNDRGDAPFCERPRPPDWGPNARATTTALISRLTTARPRPSTCAWCRGAPLIRTSATATGCVATLG